MSMRSLVVNGMVLGCVLAAGAQDRKIVRKDLPAAVAATIDQETRGATIKGYSTEKEHGRVTYEAETMVNGRTRDIEIAQDGRVNEIEEEVDIASLPAKVQHALNAKAADGRITKVEALTRAGRLVAYEATMVKNGRHSEFQVTPNGGALAHAED
jgi:uncharacterized membrane protein YkoI